MQHRGIEYTLKNVERGFWQWTFKIGNRVVRGKTEANLKLLAERRVKMRIDKELRQPD